MHQGLFHRIFSWKYIGWQKEMEVTRFGLYNLSWN